MGWRFRTFLPNVPPSRLSKHKQDSIEDNVYAGQPRTALYIMPEQMRNPGLGLCLE
jgi:hypothetical protein